MKKNFKYFKFLCLIVIAFISNVSALEPYYVNQNGVELSKEEYEELIERFSEGFVMTASNKLLEDALANKDMVSVSSEQIQMARTSYYYNCSSYSKTTDFGDYQACVNATVTPSTKVYNFELFIEWNPTEIPSMVKSHDIMAMRWNSNFNANSYTGIQWNANQIVNYSNQGTNSKWGTNGAGISMNIIDDTNDFLTLTTNLQGTFNEKSSTTIYMGYFHTKRNVTLAQSKSYTFSSSGLGNVLSFSNSTIQGYYTAVPMTFTLTPEYVE